MLKEEALSLQRNGKVKRNGAEMVVDVLVRHQVEVVFGLPGGAVLPLYDALYDAPFRHVLARHEQGAALMADGYARVSGKPGVCIATSGPGATNLITGLATSRMDSIPVVAITGNVPRAVMGTDAFQEADTVGISMPVTKHNFLVDDVNKLEQTLHDAFRLAVSGRPGPVLVDIPKDVFMDIATPMQPQPEVVNVLQPPRPAYDPSLIELAAAAIAKAHRPVIYAGGGVITANASSALRAMARQLQIPVTTTVMALGAFPADDPLFLGMPGMHGTYAANMALTETDCLIAVGCRFDDRVTGNVAKFAPHAYVIHVDIDATEHHKIKPAHVPIVANARDGLEALLAATASLPQADHRPWLDQVARWRREHPYVYDRESEELLPQRVIEGVGRATNGEAVIVTGVGQHQMWAAMFYPYKRPRQLLTSGGLGTMGYGLPAAIGAQIADPDATVVCVDGDGSFQINVQELGTLADLQLPVKIVLVNNGCHGMVRQWQELFHGNRISHSRFQTQPDFVALAQAYGIHGMRVDHPDALDDALDAMLRHDGPVLLECVVRQEENCLPIVAPGEAISNMIQAPRP